MKIQIARAMWGLTEGTTLEDKVRLVAEAGYDAIETWAPECHPAEWNAMMRDHGLSTIIQVYPASREEIRPYLEKAAPFEPILLVSHSGRDRMTFDEGCAYFEEALKLEKQFGISIGHETHRHRLFYSPWDTARYLRAFDDLRITADFSHWVCVCESLLGDMGDFLDIAMGRAIHIHSRVGHIEGPQVPHPAAPEYAECLTAHEKWWDEIRARRQKEGAKRLTVTAEFGPPPYLPQLPFTGQPVADLWEVCLWMKAHLKKRWSC